MTAHPPPHTLDTVKRGRRRLAPENLEPTIKFAASARWASRADLLPAPDAAAALAPDLNAIGATTATDLEVLTLQVEADDATDASARVGQILAQVVPHDADQATPGFLTALSVTPADTEDTELDVLGVRRWHFPDLVGLSEIAAMARVSRQRAQQWSQDRADFPSPVLVTAAGPLYARTAAKDWIRTKRRPAGRPPAT